MSLSRFLLIFALLMMGLFSRLIPHLPNFTSLNAIALFGAVSLNCSFSAFGLVSLIMLLSDYVLGFHPTLSFVYLSFGLTTLLGFRLKNDPSPKRIFKTSVYASLLFFFVTNFGDWYMGALYPKTIEGLSVCYLAGLPFLGNQLLGDLIYTILLFGLFLAWKSRPLSSIRYNKI